MSRAILAAAPAEIYGDNRYSTGRGYRFANRSGPELAVIKVALHERRAHRQKDVGAKRRMRSGDPYTKESAAEIHPWRVSIILA